MPDTDPNFGLIYNWLLGSSAWKPDMDANLLKIGTLQFPSAISDLLTAPPGAETEGDIYIPKGTATGVWAGHENDIALFINASYTFYTPKAGWKVVVQSDSNYTKRFDGSLWVRDFPAAQPASADQAVVTPSNTDGEIGALTFSATPTKAECEALRDACETVADDMRSNNVLLNEIRSALVSTDIIKGGV